MRPKRESHAGQLRCPKCNLWKHPNQFARRKRQTPIGSVWEFNPLCRLCEQTERTNKKNIDRAKACLESRAANLATKLEVSRPFVLNDLNYRALVPVFRALMNDPEAVCQNCAHPFRNERDMQLDHRAPPRHRKDWARYHARNVQVVCQSCNGTKHKKDYEKWLDDEESNRNSANAWQKIQPITTPATLTQGFLFDL